MTERLPTPWDDDALVDYYLEQANTEETGIDSACARVIASQLHDGQASALHDFVTTGIVDYERISRELEATLQDPEIDEHAQDRIAVLVTYLQSREDTGPVEGWSRIWLRPPKDASGWEGGDDEF